MLVHAVFRVHDIDGQSATYSTSRLGNIDPTGLPHISGLRITLYSIVFARLKHGNRSRQDLVHIGVTYAKNAYEATDAWHPSSSLRVQGRAV